VPKDFDSCVKNGGKVRTIQVKRGYYAHVCIPKGGGSSKMGEVKKKKGAR
jgi:hypothetical protein